MPIKDPVRKREATRAWRERVMPQGYGKWLYARRKLRFDDEVRFRKALEMIVEMDPTTDAGVWAQAALDESQRAEAALGPWTPPD